MKRCNCKRKVIVLTAVNIPETLVEPLSLMLRGEAVQYEFAFCEKMVEQSVENLLQAVKNSDINSFEQ